MRQIIIMIIIIIIISSLRIQECNTSESLMHLHFLAVSPSKVLCTVHSYFEVAAVAKNIVVPRCILTCSNI